MGLPDGYAAIYDHTGKPLAALGLTVPVERLRPKLTNHYAPKLTAAADAISSLMGAPGK